LSRIEEVEWSREEADLPAQDKDWEQWVTLQVRPHQNLTHEQRKAVERDYAMRNGLREATIGYGPSKEKWEAWTLTERRLQPACDGNSPRVG
jgi:hypothetical protein